MKYVSCRKDFTDVDNFAPFPNMRYAPDASVTVAQMYPEGRELIMVHGYNTGYENVADACRSNAESIREVGLDYVLPVCWLWPGLGNNPFEALQFHRAQGMADQAADHLVKYLTTRDSKDRPVLMGHSLGCRVILETLRKYNVLVEQVVLLGAAVANNCFAPGERYEHVGAGTMRGVLVFHSKRDDVLGRAFKIDQLGQDALGNTGPLNAPAWVKAFDRTDAVADHNEYRHDMTMWRTVAANLKAQSAVAA